MTTEFVKKKNIYLTIYSIMVLFTASINNKKEKQKGGGRYYGIMKRKSREKKVKQMYNIVIDQVEGEKRKRR